MEMQQPLVSDVSCMGGECLGSAAVQFSYLCKSLLMQRTWGSEDAAVSWRPADSPLVTLGFKIFLVDCFSWDEMIDSCVLRLSHDLIQHHVQFLHERSHKNNDDEQKEVFASMEISAPDFTLITQQELQAPKISNQGRSCPDECQSTNASVQIDPSGNPTVAQDIPAQNTMDHEAVPTRPDEMQDNSVRRSPDRFEIHTMACDPGDDHVTSIAGRDAAGHNFVHSVPPAMNRGNSTQFDTTNEKTNGANNDEKILESTSYEENCRSDIQIYENTESIEHLNDLQRAENSVTSADNTEISRNNVSAEAHVENNELKTNNPLDDLVSGHLINGYLQDNTKNPSLPTSPCLYKCCSACFRAVYKMVHDNLSNSLSPNHCLTVDDMHDILSSWSLNLLSTVRKYYSTQDMVNCEENFGKMQNQETRLEHCACHVDVTLLPRECICHMEGNDNDEATSTNPHSLFGQRLNYFFKDGIWMPSDDTSETTLHCSFKRLCVCSVLGTISMFSQSPVDDIV
ncbi:hypothetical protein PR202_gb05247 [Eleusine coracana subsp. coracana]|uniref:Uncharacterized protein n=1 Tax=Eleusine coracana subsp. coracana TaxID=191504 RepID=A0AAV5E6J3_ELECO|nr:hypothetical protein PR202_gb05247 [Eleusine coracana subsp. coracana]